MVGGQTTPSQGQSRESSRGREPHRVDIEKSSKPAPPAAKELTEEEIEKKTKTILDEYLHVHDLKVMGIEKCTRLCILMLVHSIHVIVSFIYLGSHTMCGGIEIPIRDALFC